MRYIPVEYGYEMMEKTQMMRFRALEIATYAHSGQMRQFEGGKFILHPIAVAKAVEGDSAKVVALLHDTVEDTSVTLEDLRDQFPEDIVDAVDRLTRRDNETYAEAIERAKGSSLSWEVKIADVRHNLSTVPESHGLSKRYKKALVLLGVKE